MRLFRRYRPAFFCPAAASGANACQSTIFKRALQPCRYGPGVHQRPHALILARSSPRLERVISCAGLMLRNGAPSGDGTSVRRAAQARAWSRRSSYGARIFRCPQGASACGAVSGGTVNRTPSAGCRRRATGLRSSCSRCPPRPPRACLVPDYGDQGRFVFTTGGNATLARRIFSVLRMWKWGPRRLDDKELSCCLPFRGAGRGARNTRKTHIAEDQEAQKGRPSGNGCGGKRGWQVSFRQGSCCLGALKLVAGARGKPCREATIAATVRAAAEKTRAPDREKAPARRLIAAAMLRGHRLALWSALGVIAGSGHCRSAGPPTCCRCFAWHEPPRCRVG